MASYQYVLNEPFISVTKSFCWMHKCITNWTSFCTGFIRAWSPHYQVRATRVSEGLHGLV